MYPEELVFGIVDSPASGGDPAVAAKLRDLTISWSRYDYRGRILRAATMEGVLDQASDLGYRWCFVQRSGHIILERWHGGEGRMRLDECVSHWISERDFLALGAAGDDECLLVDVRRWEELGRPDLRQAVVDDVGEALDERCLSLARLAPEERVRLTRLLGDGIRGYSNGETWSDPRIGTFLEEVRLQVVNAGRGVFLWNLEPYDDVQTAPHGFEPPITTLYSVASGFKPNVLLESFGFDAHTRVVFFDYSAKALEVKRLLVEEWDGQDFPEFVIDLFRTVTSEAAHYHLWDGATPETLEPSRVEQAWERELEVWGGERAFSEHWSRYRQLGHEFVRCDVLGDATRLLKRVEPEENAVIWWSNAFFSVWGNWLSDAAERQRRYERFVEVLAERNPHLFLYGSDASNSSVNDIQAGEYRDLLREAEREELVPLAANAREIRF
jgi:hypothetical protein